MGGGGGVRGGGGGGYFSGPVGELKYQFLAQLANAEPKSEKVKFVESNFIKLSLLMSLHLCDNEIKYYFDNLGHVFIH